MNTVIYWFRHDLRLIDNPGFTNACQLADNIVPVYVNDASLTEPTQWEFSRLSTHRTHFLSTALTGLDELLQEKGSKLLQLEGEIVQELVVLAQSLGTTEIHCEKIAAPFEQSVVDKLRAKGLKVVETWQSSMLDFGALPFTVENLADIFTTFRTQIEKCGLKARKPQKAISIIPPLPEKFNLQKSIPTIHSAIQPHQKTYPYPLADYPLAVHSFPYDQTDFFGSQQAAVRHLENYFSTDLAHTFKETRNGLCGIDYSTKFSPWLSIGSVSAPMIIEALDNFEEKNGSSKSSYWIWFELMWRDYFRLLHLKYGKLLYREQGISSHAKNANKYAKAHLLKHAAQFEQWCEGRTGVPLIDAAMRELKSTGYLSNRLRQVVASYLIYDLGLDWRAGAAWFESQLIDYDVYSNQGNWLYIAGRGSDPRGGRPFNVQKQTHDHDPQGQYRKSWGCT